MKNKKRILKNKNKNIFYKKKGIMKGGQEETENKYKINHSGLLGVLDQAANIFKMGANIVVNKGTKLLNLFAISYCSAPNRQVLRPLGNTVLCIPFVQGSYPAAMNCCAFSLVKES